MDRQDRQPVNGTWARRPAPVGDCRHARQFDPPGWQSHHIVYRHSHLIPLDPDELWEAIRMRAFELFEDRMCTGRAGTADEDWLRAEREVRTRQAEIVAGQGTHPAVP
jgi:hypothetical protein